MSAVLPFRDINVHASPSQYAFTSPSSPSSRTLVVNRPSGDIALIDGKTSGAQRISSIAGILGIISLRLDKYIIIITKATPVGKIKGHTVYKVAGTELLPLRERQLHDQEEDIYLTLIRNVLNTSPMFFSYTYDVTNAFQRQAEANDSAPLWKRADDRFFWNRFLQSDLIDFRNGAATSRYSQRGGDAAVDPYILPVMSGMLEIRPTSVKGKPLTFILTTRKSRFRVGTRYFTRGIDEEGHVGNFNETEQIVVLEDASNGSMNGSIGNRETQVLAYVQTRGSVPVYWAEVNTLHYTPSLQIRGIQSAKSAAEKHFAEQISLYGDNYLVNLVNQKGRERRVKEAYEDMVHLLVSNSTEDDESDRKSKEKFTVIESKNPKTKFDRLHYVYFDFHNETKGLKWHRAQLLMEQLEAGVRAGGYFRSVDMPGHSGRVEVRSQQTAVVRTNCMDCLDRTNVVQSMLGRYILSRMLIDLGYMREGENASDDAAFEHLFRNIWADNADVVSKSYSGTGALKTDFTRLGVRTRKGAFNDFTNSATRYLKNNFLDGPRQDAFDLFLGNYVPSMQPTAATGGKGGHFTDTRPLVIQSIPYILAASVFFILVASLTTRDASATIWPLRMLVLLCLGVAGISAVFIWSHGTLYVNWPKLNTPSFALEGYREAFERATKTPVIGPFVAMHERGRSDAKMGFMEEGKKRIE